MYLEAQNTKDEKEEALSHLTEGNASLGSIQTVSNKLQSNLKYSESLYLTVSLQLKNKQALIHLIHFPIFNRGPCQRQWHSYKEEQERCAVLCITFLFKFFVVRGWLWNWAINLPSNLYDKQWNRIQSSIQKTENLLRFWKHQSEWLQQSINCLKSIFLY